MAQLQLPDEITKGISAKAAASLDRFMKLSTRRAPSPQAAEDRILTALALTLAPRSRAQ